MALEMRLSCEKCGHKLPQDGEAYICSYECSFCADCTQEMSGTCPNCGGELLRRPKRQVKATAQHHKSLLYISGTCD